MGRAGARTIVLDGRCGHEQEQDLLSATHLPWALEPRVPWRTTGEIVRARSYDLGRARLVECMAAPVAARRGRREIDRTEGEWIGVLMQLAGRATILHGDEVVEARPGSIIVWDSTVPGRFTVTEKEHKRNIFLPRDLVAALSPSLDVRSAIPLQPDEPAVGLFRAVADDVANCAADLDDAARHAASRVLAELLAACLRGRQVAGRAALQVGQFANACAYIEQRIGDPDLRPASIAAGLRVPLRTLQDVFAQRGTTIWGYIKTLRLARCHAQLQRGDGRTITEIAFAFGFTNAGHFSRSFRDRYGVSPRDVRASAGTAIAPATPASSAFVNQH